MVRSCCVCRKEKMGDTDKRSFHVFPKNEEERNAWLKVLGRDTAAKTAVICSSHFPKNHFWDYENPDRRRLKRGVDIVPSIDLCVISNSQQSRKIIGREPMGVTPHSRSMEVLQDRTNVIDTIVNESLLPQKLTIENVCDPDNFPATAKDTQHFQLLSSSDIMVDEISNENVCVTNELHVETHAVNINNFKRSREESSLANVFEPPTKKIHTGFTHRAVSDFGSSDKAVCSKRPRDTTESTVEQNESSTKKLKLTVNYKTMFFSSSDFVNEEKWSFFQEYIEHERQEKKNLQRNYKNMKDSVKNFKDLQKTMDTKKMLSKKGENIMNTLPAGVQSLLDSILLGKKYKTYPDELRNFALNLHFYSPSAYSFIKENFGDLLPSLSTLRHYLRKYHFEPGVTMESIESAKRLVEDGKLKEKHILFNLTCDEMAIRQKVEWDSNAKEMVGFVDYGSSKVILDNKSTSSIASNALVFMLVALNSHFKIPVAYYLVKSSDGKEKETLLQEVLDVCFQNGLIIANLTFDGMSSNITIVENLGAKLRHSTSEVFFEYGPSEKPNKIRVTLDSCHALKLIRNTMAKHDITDDKGETISFAYIKALQILQKNEQLHLATKLRKKHIYFQNEIMKVHIAAQTLSTSVSKALDYCRVDLHLKEFLESAATSRFCQNVNDGFDILNSRNIFSKNPGKHAISKRNLEEKQAKVKELVNYFQSLQISGTPILKTKQHTGFLGVITGLGNMIAMAKDLFTTFDNFDFILTYKFSQDHLETFFACIRRLGGLNNNPTVRQFKAAYEKLLAHVSISVPLAANCMPCDETILQKVDSRAVDSVRSDDPHEPRHEQSVQVDATELEVIFNLLEDVQLNDYVDDVVAYISGCVVKLIKKKISCATCTLQLELENDVAPVSRLQRRKCYGKLISASHDVIEICKSAEKIFRMQINFTEKKVLEKMVLKTMHVLPSNILDQSDHVFEQEVLSDHRTELIKIIAEQYLNIRLHYAASTDEEKQDRIRMRLNKLLLFKGV